VLPYILQAVTFAALAVKTVVDWPEHQESPRKLRGDIALLALGLGTLVGALVVTHRDRLTSATREAAASARADQMRNDFHDQLANMSGQLEAIRTKGVSEPLLRQISSLQGQISDLKQPDSGKKSKPAPKVQIVATLWDPDSFKIPIKSTTAPIGPDRVVTVSFSILNPTDIPLRGPINGWIRNCADCQFVGPLPPGMMREDEESPTLQFQLIELLPHTAAGKYTVRIHVPIRFGEIAVDIHTYCDGCVNSDDSQRLSVQLIPGA
jgi:hypothetical protein